MVRYRGLCDFTVSRLNGVKQILLYSWCFSCYSAPIHWLVHGHMTSNNETVSCQMPWAGNYDVKRETVHYYPRLKVAWCCRRNLSAFFNFAILQITYNDWSLEEQWILIWGKQNSLFPSRPVIKVPITPKYFVCLNKSLHLFETHCAFGAKWRNAFQTGAKIYLSEKNILGLWAL